MTDSARSAAAKPLPIFRPREYFILLSPNGGMVAPNCSSRNTAAFQTIGSFHEDCRQTSPPSPLIASSLLLEHARDQHLRRQRLPKGAWLPPVQGSLRKSAGRGSRALRGKLVERIRTCGKPIYYNSSTPIGGHPVPTAIVICHGSDRLAVILILRMKFSTINRE